MNVKGNIMKNTELKRTLSQVDVLSLATGCIIGWGAFVMPGNMFLPNAGILGTGIAILISVFIMTIIACNYHYMINRFPLAGGEFTYASKAFGRVHGFICAWFLGISYLSIVPLNATALALIGRNLMGGMFERGYNYQFAGYDVYVQEVLLAIVALIFLGYLSIKGVKFVGIVQTILISALIGGVIILSIVAFTQVQYDLIRDIPLYSSEKSILSGIIAIVAIAPWAFVGFDTVPQAAEELKFSYSKTKKVMIFSIVFAGMIYIMLNTITALVIPTGYNNWIDYVQHIKDLDGIEALPTFHAAYALLGNAGLIIIGSSVGAAVLSGIVGFYMATSRLLYAMAQEKVIPKWFGILHPEYRTPYNAILFTMAIACVAPFFGRNALGWIVDMASIGAAIGYGYTSAATLYYMKKYNDCNIWFKCSAWIGILFAFIIALILLIPIEGLSCSLGIESYICLGIWTVLGVLFFIKSNNAVKE